MGEIMIEYFEHTLGGIISRDWLESLHFQQLNYIEDKCPAIQANKTTNSVGFLAPNDSCQLFHFDRMMKKLKIQGQKACDFIFWSQVCPVRIFYEVKTSNQKGEAEKQLLASINFINGKYPDAIDKGIRHYAVYSCHDNSQSKHQAVKTFASPQKYVNKPMKLESTDLDNLNFDFFVIFSHVIFDLTEIN